MKKYLWIALLAWGSGVASADRVQTEKPSYLSGEMVQLDGEPDNLGQLVSTVGPSNPSEWPLNDATTIIGPSNSPGNQGYTPPPPPPPKPAPEKTVSKSEEIKFHGTMDQVGCRQISNVYTFLTTIKDQCKLTARKDVFDMFTERRNKCFSIHGTNSLKNYESIVRQQLVKEMNPYMHSKADYCTLQYIRMKKLFQ